MEKNGGGGTKIFAKSRSRSCVSENDRAVFARFLDPQKLTVTPTGADTEILSAQSRKGDTQLGWSSPDRWIGFPMKMEYFFC